MSSIQTTIPRHVNSDTFVSRTGESYIDPLYSLAYLQPAEVLLHTRANLFIRWDRSMDLLQSLAKLGGRIETGWKTTQEGNASMSLGRGMQQEQVILDRLTQQP